LNIKIIYDNNSGKIGLNPSWGFSCLVKTPEKTILFDTGGDSTILLDNMRKVGIDPAEIDIIIISHLHSDHIGGLQGLLKINPQVNIYLPSNWIKMKTCTGKIIHVKDYQEISPRILAVTQRNNLSLVLDGKDGLIVVASRIPKKVLKMIEKVKKIKKREIYLLIAPFCLHTTDDIKKTVDSFKAQVKKIIPCHCCGEPQKIIFQEKFGKNYIEAGVGSTIKI